MRLCRELGRVLKDRHFLDVYAGTLICPRRKFFASQIIFFFIFYDEPEPADFCDPVKLPDSDQLSSFLHNFLTNLARESPLLRF